MSLLQYEDKKVRAKGIEKDPLHILSTFITSSVGFMATYISPQSKSSVFFLKFRQSNDTWYSQKSGPVVPYGPVVPRMDLSASDIVY